MEATPCLTMWAVYDDQAKLVYYTLSENNGVQDEGDILGVSGSINLEALTIDVDGTIYFINNDGSGLIRAKARVEAVFNSEKLNRERSTQLVEENQERLQLSDRQFKRWAGKRYLVLVAVSKVVDLEPFAIDRSQYGNMDDWLPVGDIESVKIDK